MLTFMRGYSVMCSCNEAVIYLSSGLRDQVNVAEVILEEVEMHFMLPSL